MSATTMRCVFLPRSGLSSYETAERANYAASVFLRVGEVYSMSRIRYLAERPTLDPETGRYVSREVLVETYFILPGGGLS